MIVYSEGNLEGAKDQKDIPYFFTYISESAFFNSNGSEVSCGQISL